MAEAKQEQNDTPSAAIAEYEFSEGENEHFAALGWSMRYAGLGWFLTCLVLVLLLVSMGLAVYLNDDGSEVLNDHKVDASE